MAVATVAYRYAKSLLDLAREKDLVADIHRDMLFFKKTVDDSRPLALMLKNPIIRVSKKDTVLRTIFKDKLNPMTMSFIDIVVRKNREGILENIADEFIRLYDGMKGIERATVITTTPLTDELRTKFKEMVAKTTGGQLIELTEKINPKLIGGYVLQLGDRQVDASVRSQLNDLKLSFLN
ncbi:ATP synthase F1 subunit delta [Rudanella paleaurantiibacter]|uniref:ATP synthase subunit delta n=1 Tax=Rudanella paleaurantiibacter TaxID=2614655 RepID=A0A7J5TX14_9BACT|nr:ATP synthase F1 subunit delta [Rudanella paleaurantiibacter]KAB7728785.1 ATP synthase F1 subunit delta [Rudanella paleaurantiibacter]